MMFPYRTVFLSSVAVAKRDRILTCALVAGRADKAERKAKRLANGRSADPTTRRSLTRGSGPLVAAAQPLMGGRSTRPASGTVLTTAHSSTLASVMSHHKEVERTWVEEKVRALRDGGCSRAAAAARAQLNKN